MSSLSSEANVLLESGLPVEEVEMRLVASAARYDREERYLSFYLLEIERRGLFRQKGFSSTGDYAFRVAGISTRKTQYLVSIARYLEKLPKVSAAFEAGEITWTKVREICRVATPETEDEWIMRAKRLTNRALERMVRHKTGTREQDFLRIPMPADVMDVWKECSISVFRRSLAIWYSAPQ